MIPYGRQHITDEDIAAVIETLQSDFLTQGPKIAEFEHAFAEYVGSTYAVAVNNGTAALHLGVLALGLQPHQKVITTPITFAASANCIQYCGAQVLFVDIDPTTYLIDIAQVEALCQTQSDVVGIIPVDFAGYPVHMEQLQTVAEKYGLWILEDACHAPGAWFIDSCGNKQFCGNGTYSNATVFSFHPVKHIATGEGGMITTNSKQVYEKLCMLRTHGITRNPEIMVENHGPWYYEMQELGYNYRITDFQCALGLSQLKRANNGLTLRNQIAEKYNKAFAHTCIQTPKVADSVYHAYHLYVIQVPNRMELYTYLRSKEIFTQVHYIPVHTMPYYKAQGYKHGDFPVAEAYYNHCLSLPMYPSLTNEQQEFVIQTILEFYNT